MITLNKMSLSYEGDTVLSEIDLNIPAGECVVICGESGSGKSSLIRVLNGLIPELFEGEIKGEGEILGHNLPVKNFNEFVKEIGVVFQNPKTQFFMNDVYSELAFSMENFAFQRVEMIKKIAIISETFDLKKYWSNTMFELSGGEKQRIAFASSCMIDHSLFLLDEPSSNLDDKNIQILTDSIQWLKNKKQTIVVAEHRLYYLLPVVDRFILMDHGRIVGDFTKEEFLKKTMTELNELGLRSLNETSLSISDYPKVSVSKAKEALNNLSCEKIDFGYKKNSTNLRVEKLLFTSNKITGIIGENGSGKTTLSQILTGLIKIKTGTVFYNEKKQTAKELIKRSFLVMQDVNLQLFFESVEKEISAKAKRLDIFDEVVTMLDLEKLLDRHPQTLSGGEKQRVAIASAILSGKEIIVMDEPTSGLDLKHMKEVSCVINSMRKFNIIIIIISHDKEFINLTCQRVVELHDGQLS
ncbi:MULTISPECIES: ABC transporter ATP-binding protein [Vagococcus]|uniref:Duplicated ATPase component BL0693 of energizing module of predicted ECF transporter n=1 Tax=Vagococcus fluvialis bH819 TaxID=1255619 RepID=A0A1X6WSP7_9ENTE|nr:MULTISPECIES: ABC transporter ATP-binding protein [Vagococcus]SLM86646.1 Duplicated ATPase component BL0693 of energizing module of predicted ECF transporter [Vagococcus fluvialis bH819]HCM90854.1 cobalt ABC transporter [Vagococcus sp.]